MMKTDLSIPLFIVAVTVPAAALTAEGVSNLPADGLASVESFSSISDEATRSAAYFSELGKVLTSPRCLNCHPAGDRPRQGDAGRLHQPPVFRGADVSCHEALDHEKEKIPDDFVRKAFSSLRTQMKVDIGSLHVTPRTGLSQVRGGGQGDLLS
jgi:hypothetical protein